MTQDAYMLRCLQLAALAAGNTAPNPMVGAVLVHNGRIIGEGYHQNYGEAHAEVNCVRSVKEEDRHLISSSVLYVSLEPCAHHGKTPPCTDLIIKERIPKVVIGCTDPFSEVNGKGIEKLRNAGVEVLSGVMEKECRDLNKRFFCFHTLHRPWIILKWAQTPDGIIGDSSGDRLLLSDEFSNRKVHQWRTEEAAILVGYRTALQDDPALTARLWPGRNPVRIVVDKNNSLPSSLQLFDGKTKTIVFNGSVEEKKNENLLYMRIDMGKEWRTSLLQWLYKENLQSLLIEGGANTIQSFIDAGLWDEARVIECGKAVTPKKPVMAPILEKEEWVNTERLQSDTIYYYHKRKPD